MQRLFAFEIVSEAAHERVNVEMKLARGTLAFGSNVPQDDACKVGGHSWLNFLSFSSGLAVASSPSFAVLISLPSA